MTSLTINPNRNHKYICRCALLVHIACKSRSIHTYKPLIFFHVVHLLSTQIFLQKQLKRERENTHARSCSTVAALASHSRLLSCKYHTHRLLLAKFLCLVIHIWVDRSRTQSSPTVNDPSRQQIDSHFAALCTYTQCAHAVPGPCLHDQTCSDRRKSQ